MTLHDGATVTAPFHARVDVAVVGSGPGGATLALRLAEAGAKVMLLELGGHYRPEDFPSEETVAYATMYRESGTRVAQGAAPFPLLSGQALGGGTVVNSGICFRTPRYYLDAWVEERGVDWAAPEVINPAYDWVESYMRVAPVQEAFLGEHNKVSLEAFAAMGWHHDVIDRNAPGCIGCGACNWGCPSGGKLSVDKAQIDAALGLGAEVLYHARAEEITFSGDKATGVTGTLLAADQHTPRGTFAVQADAVAVCAGAVDTPVLLQRSGVGGPDDGIGAGLRVHPSSGIGGFFPDRAVAPWKGVPQGAYSGEFMRDEGIIIETAAMPVSAFYGLAPHTADPTAWLRMFPHVALAGGMIHDSGSGTVRPGLGDQALVFYTLSDDDLRRLKLSMKWLGEAYFRAGAAGVISSIRGVGLVHSQRELAAAVDRVERPGDLLLYSSHPQASVRVHADPERGPLHPDFHLHGYPNLYVADSSIFPDCLGVNPQITIMAAARIAAERLLART